MRRRALLGASGWGALACAASFPAHAQPAMPVVGILITSVDETVMAAIRRGLERGGYVEGRNVAIVVRSAEGDFERLPQLAAELVERQVSVIVAWGSNVPGRVAKAATSKIPIVFLYGGDPIADGLVRNFNRPGGNVTGVTLSNSALLAKRLELARSVVPGLADVAVLINPKTGPLAQGQVKDAEAAAPKLGLRPHFFEASSNEELDRAFAAMQGAKVGALVTSTDPLFSFALRHKVVALAAQYRLPTIYGLRTGPDSGGLISYGTDIVSANEQVGAYVARILKGDRAGDLPVVQGARFETVINLKTAKAIGLQIPPQVLRSADEVIE